MKRLLTSLILSITFIGPILAGTCPDCDGENNANREQWFKEMRLKKHQFMVRELSLTDQQKEKFFAIYDKFEQDMKAINDQTREIERTISKKADATDAEYDAAIDAVYNQRYREWTVENKTKEELSKILTKQQLLKLKHAEMKFTRALMKQHRNSEPKHQGPKPKKQGTR